MRLKYHNLRVLHVFDIYVAHIVPFMHVSILLLSLICVPQQKYGNVGLFDTFCHPASYQFFLPVQPRHQLKWRRVQHQVQSIVLKAKVVLIEEYVSPGKALVLC